MFNLEYIIALTMALIIVSLVHETNIITCCLIIILSALYYKKNRGENNE